MLVANANNSPALKFGNISESDFGIAASGKAFDILANALYQNKIGSIVREISCNASDSHIAAGTPELPIRIHVPTNMEPWSLLS